ncbi:MAG: calcium/proton exchanger [Gemmatimonadales bacterium]
MTIPDQLRADAATLAASLEADFVGTEHLFLAWLETATGPAADTMRTAGLTPEAFRTLLASGKQRRRGPGPVAAPGGLSSQGQRVLELAAELATADDRTESNADDVILAMIREPRGALARALSEFQLKPSKLRAIIRPGSAEVSRPEREPREPREPKEPKEPREPREPKPPREPREPREKQEPKPKQEARPKPEPRPKPEARPRRDPETDDIPFARAPERPRLTPPPKPPRVVPEETKKRGWPLSSVLFLAVPLAVYLSQTNGDPVWIFVAACVGVLPLAGLMGHATEHLAERTGPTLGGLLNATFGNAAELIIAIAALRAGYVDLVKASITGSILGNLLLILGLSLVVGGSRRSLLSFNRTNAGMGAAMLALAVAGLIFPALFHATHPEALIGVELHLSEAVATVLAVTYGFSLLFVLRTHKPLFGGGGHGGLDRPAWGVGKAIGLLALGTAGVAVMSEILVHQVGAVTANLGLSQAFLGLIIIPIIGNAAEHATAIVVARKGQTDLAFQIALGSSTQVALLIAPILVFAGAFMGVAGMNLVFSTFEIVGLCMAVIVSAFITLDGESHWFEGVQLLALYALIGAAAWFI